MKMWSRMLVMVAVGVLVCFGYFGFEGTAVLAAGLNDAEMTKGMDRLVAKVPEISEMAKKNPTTRLTMQIEAEPTPGSAERIERDYYRIYVGFYVEDGGPGHRSRWATFLLHKDRDEILWANYLSGNSYIPLEDWRKFIYPDVSMRQNDWMCLPFYRVGPIQPDSSAAEIIKMFGSGNVERRTIYGAEGTEKFDVSVVFPGTANELIVFWENNQYGQRPSSVSVRKAGSAWKTVYGIRIGTPLAVLNRVNDGVFTFYGFAWDYGGTVERSWGDGKLAAIEGLQVVLQETRELPRTYYGDKILRSDEANLLPDVVRVSRLHIQLN